MNKSELGERVQHMNKSELGERELSVPHPKTFFRSKWWSEVVADGGKTSTMEHARTYKRPKREDEIKGKLALKFAKRQKIKLWKAEQIRGR